MLGHESIDLIDISGGTYFPGAVPTTDRPSSGPYYMRFAKRARRVVDTPLMLTGGFKTRDEAAAAVASGVVDVVGLARPLVLDPDLPERWLRVDAADVAFPRFQSTPPGSVTAWYTMRLTALANHCEEEFTATPESALAQYESRDASRVPLWSERFPSNG